MLGRILVAQSGKMKQATIFPALPAEITSLLRKQGFCRFFRLLSFFSCSNVIPVTKWDSFWTYNATVFCAWMGK